jgi:glucose 1-dehydrogenase
MVDTFIASFFIVVICIGIRVLQIDLGPFLTDMMKTAPQEFIDNIASITLQKRLGNIEEEATPSILFLASKEASYITGSSLFVDGGAIAL